jgi:ADP-heptose:LPS heptosyltransferase
LNYTNILIIQTAFIGDAILASSLVEKLHSKFPNASVTVLVRKGNEGIYLNHPFLKETLVWDKNEGKYRNLFKLLFQIRKNKYDLVVNCHRYASSGFLTAFSGAHHKAGYKQTPFAYMLDHAPKHTFGDGKHEVERYNELIEDFTGKEFSLPKIYPSVVDIEKVKPYQNKEFICIAPSSVWFTKQLPKHKWIELCDAVSETTTIYVLGSPADKDLANAIIQLSKHKGIVSLCGDLSLLQSAALMQKAKMNYVNDSAPLHLASATNSSVTAFYCSTVKEFGFYPLSEKSRVVDAGKMDCRPCGMHGYKACPKGHFNCGNKIEIQTAINA